MGQKSGKFPRKSFQGSQLAVSFQGTRVSHEFSENLNNSWDARNRSQPSRERSESLGSTAAEAEERADPASTSWQQQLGTMEFAKIGNKKSKMFSLM